MIDRAPTLRSVTGRGIRLWPLTPGIGRALMAAAGLLLLLLATPPFIDFPRVGFWLLPVGLGYLGLLLVLPRLWLYVLPLVTVGLDLTPWTGRFTYTELDLVVLLTLVSGLLSGRCRFSVYAPGPAMFVLVLYLLVVALGFSGWIFLLQPPVAATDNPYYTSEYAYKVAKGLWWGVCLVPLWGYLLVEDKQRSTTAFVGGMSLAAILLLVIVLWERGTLGLLLNLPAWRELVSSLLDLTSSYRVTAWLSDMHTGGEAYDGLLLCLLPVTLYGVVHGRLGWTRILGMLGFVALAYAMLVGFTRTTYAAFGLAVGCYALLTAWTRFRSGLSPPFSPVITLAALVLATAAAVLAFRVSGTYGLASFGALMVLAFGAGYLPRRVPALCLAWPAAIALVGVALWAHFNSRWVSPSAPSAVFLGCALMGSFALAQRLFATGVRSSHTDRLVVLASLIVLPALSSLAFGGHQINERFSRLGDDFETRGEHWQNVVNSGKTGFLRPWLGNGTGSFPASYIAAYPERVQAVGSFDVSSTAARKIFRLGGGRDLVVGQRVAIEPDTVYTANLSVRSAYVGRLMVSLCERNIIYASQFTPRCARGKIFVKPSGDRFEDYSVDINSGDVGRRDVLQRWPTLVTVEYAKLGTLVEIDSVELLHRGANSLRNSNFELGMDYWFYYNDFSHLPWHVKNTFLQVWFETGWLGLGMFLALVMMLVRTNMDRHAQDSLTPVYTTGVIAVCLFGLFGSPLDSARVAWMFYFFLCAGLAKPADIAPSRQ